MSETTERHALPYVIAAQSQKHVTVNEAFRALDALVQPSVRSASVTMQPGSAAPGEGYVLPAGASGTAWAGMAEGTLTVFQDGTWTAFAPVVGLTAYVEDEGTHRVYDGRDWVRTASSEGGSAGAGTAAPQTTAPRFGINAAADDTNRLAIASDAVLHSHDGGDVRHVLNKAGEADTASLVFQTGYSGRAEIGLTGGDDFAFKVSGDGATFREAIVIDRATGAVRLPNTPTSGGSSGQALDPLAFSLTSTRRNAPLGIPSGTWQALTTRELDRVVVSNGLLQGGKLVIGSDAGGVWMFGGTVTFNALDDGKKAIVGLRVNGDPDSLATLGRGVSGGTDLTGYGGNMILRLEAGDEVALYCFTNDASSPALSQYGGHHSFFGHRVAP